jgi:hypothetical protein
MPQNSEHAPGTHIQIPRQSECRELVVRILLGLLTVQARPKIRNSPFLSSPDAVARFLRKRLDRRTPHILVVGRII